MLEEIKENDKGIYADIAQIQTSNILFEQGKTNEAIAILEKILDNQDINKKMRDMTAIKLASYKLDTAPKAEVEALLNPLGFMTIGHWKYYSRFCFSVSLTFL